MVLLEQQTHDLYDYCKDIVVPVASALFTLFALLAAVKAIKDNFKLAQANFEFQLVLSHRDIWRNILEKKLTIIVKSDATVADLTEEISKNINFIIINVQNSFVLNRKGLLSKEPSELLVMKDIGEFFSLPLPALVWEKVSHLHEDEFRKYIQNCRLIHEGKPLPPKGLRKLVGGVINYAFSIKNRVAFKIRRVKSRLTRI